jgi:hypothetical protein
MVSVRLGVGQGILGVWMLKKGSRVCSALVVDVDGSVISYWGAFNLGVLGRRRVPTGRGETPLV